MKSLRVSFSSVLFDLIPLHLGTQLVYHTFQSNLFCHAERKQTFGLIKLSQPGLLICHGVRVPHIGVFVLALYKRERFAVFPDRRHHFLPDLCMHPDQRDTVAPLLLPDYTTGMSISATMCLSPSLSHLPCYLQDRDEIAGDVIIAISPGTPKPLCESHHSVVNTLTVQSGISSRATVASIKVLFRGVKASN